MTIARTCIYKSLAVVALAAGVAAPGLAADGAIRAGVTAGTLGVGPELAYRFSDRLGVRANATFFSLGTGISSDNIDYHGSVKLRSFGAMIDVYPFGGGIYVSGGARINGNKGLASAKLSDGATVEIGDNIYSSADVGSLSGRLETKNFAPQLTVGYAGGRRRGFHFGGEVGVLFQGSLRVPPFEVGKSGIVSAADLEKQRADLQNKIDDYKVWPIAQVRIGYRF